MAAAAGLMNGAAALQVGGVDAVADSFENGLALAAEGLELAFGADLGGDVHAVADDEGFAAFDVDDAAAGGDV